MTINRLLAMGQPPAVDVSDPNHMVVGPMSGQAMYSAEMKILHEGSAALVAENADLRAVLKEMSAIIGEEVWLTSEQTEQLRALIASETPDEGSAG